MKNTPRHIPLLRPILPLIAGVVLCAYFPLSLSATIIGSVIVTGLASLYFLRKSQVGFTYGLLIFFTALGYIYAQVQIPKFQAHAFVPSVESADTLLVKINAPLEEKANSYKTTAKIKLHRKRGISEEAKGNLLLYFPKNADLPGYGDEISIRTYVKEIESPKNEGDFDYKGFLFKKHIYHSAYVGEQQYQITSADRGFSITAAAHQTRSNLLTRLESVFTNSDDFSVASALILGYKNDLSPEIKQAYSGAGAMHILAVSGLHVGIVYMVILFFLKPLPAFKHKKIIYGLIIIAGIWGYAFITGLSASVTRAATMLTFVAVGNMSTRNSNIYNTIAASCVFIIVVFGPFKILEIGMLLSYAAVLGIVYFQPKLASLYRPKTVVTKYIWELLCVSVAAQLVTAPIALCVFGIFPNLFLITNLIVIPCAFIVLVTGISYLLISFTGLPVADFIGQLLSFEFHALNSAVNKINALPYAVTSNVQLSVPETVIIYAFILTATLGMAIQHKKTIVLSGMVALFFGCYHIGVKVAAANQPTISLYASDAKVRLNSGLRVEHFWGSDQNENSTKHINVEHRKGLQNHLLYCDGRVYWKIDENQRFVPKHTKVNYIVVSADLPAHKIKEFLTPDVESVILGEELSYYNRKAWADALYKNNIDFHDTAEKGMYAAAIQSAK